MNTKIDENKIDNMLDIAVVGMSCTFPQAENTEEFWENLCGGVETVRFFSNDELLEKGVSEKLLKNPDYVKASSVLENIDMFDGEFFGINPNEAKAMDPQHRIFLQCSWEALEDAGYDPYSYDGDIGVFAGVAMNSYISDVLSKNQKFFNSIGKDQLMIGNDKDFLPTLVSYKLNLTGPSVNVNTACSTSLVAIHLARQSLLLGESDIALTGGVSVFASNGKGYLYQKDGIQSPDGHCKAFDAKAKGTIWGDGCGVIVLKRLTDAISDGDNIYAVIKGSAVNNDGSQKVGYTAPSVEGQSKAIVEALEASNLSAEQINYIEAHGTGTQLGDPVELSALTLAFESYTDRKGYCPIGSVKTNIGHLNSAAGAAGFIKTALAIKNKKLPPSINFDSPNPKIDFENSPFYVNTELVDFDNNDEPLRAGISSMGIGGTNSHVIIEQAPKPKRDNNINIANKEQILVLSARTKTALEHMAIRLANYIELHMDLSLEDIAFTLQCGRKSFKHRMAIVCDSLEGAITIIRDKCKKYMFFNNELESNTNLSIKYPLLEQWLNGEDVKWLSVWENSQARRVSLPTYPFEKRRYWVEGSTSDEIENSSNNRNNYYVKSTDMSDWYYIPSWKHSQLPFIAHKEDKKCNLVFTDKINIGDNISKELIKQGDTCITVNIGDRYEQVSEYSFIINPTVLKDYEVMLDKLKENNMLPDNILFFWSIEENIEDNISLNIEELVALQENGFFSILNLVKSFDELSITKPIKLKVFTNNIFDVIGSEDICVNSSTIPGICVVIQQTYQNIDCRIIDIILHKEGTKNYSKLIDNMLKEVNQNTSEMVCAYRNNRRYSRGYEALKVEADAKLNNPITQEGVYLVFCGLEGIGFLITQHIINVIGGRVLMLEEDGFPDIQNWEQWLNEVGEEHHVSQRIKNAKSIIGEKAHYIGTVTDLYNYSDKVDKIEKMYGKVNGIIHAPGASNAKRVKTIKSSTPETWYEHFKVVSYSLMVIDKIFEEKDLDFRIMLNSLGTVLGGNGFINIATISNYSKTYITKKSRAVEQSWSVQCWDSWLIEWGQIGKFFPEAMYKRVEPSILTNQQGIESFLRTFAVNDVIELAICGIDLSSRYNRWVKLDSLKSVHKNEDLLPRPKMDIDYVAPRNKNETIIESIFSELLGIEKIGVNDNFFELGGHSLLGVQLASKVRNIFSVDMDLYQLIGNPTVALLVEHVTVSN